MREPSTPSVSFSILSFYAHSQTIVIPDGPQGLDYGFPPSAARTCVGVPDRTRDLDGCGPPVGPVSRARAGRGSERIESPTVTPAPMVRAVIIPSTSVSSRSPACQLQHQPRQSLDPFARIRDMSNLGQGLRRRPSVDQRHQQFRKGQSHFTLVPILRSIYPLGRTVAEDTQNSVGSEEGRTVSPR